VALAGVGASWAGHGELAGDGREGRGKGRGAGGAPVGAARERLGEGATGAAPCSLLPVRVKKKREKKI
jgi:hypothetical protein